MQQKFIQKLQEDNSKVAVFKATVKTQEKVINKLQTLVESKLKQRRRSSVEPLPNVQAEIESLRKENDELREKVYLRPVSFCAWCLLRHASLRHMPKQLHTEDLNLHS